MSIGLGIFLSTVLLVIVWQIDKRSAWSRLRKSALWIVVIVLLLVLAFVVYSVGDDMLRTRRESEAEKKLAASGVAEYMGVKLGATQAEVKYALGKPDTDDPMGLAKDGTPTYFYHQSSRNLFVFFKEDKVIQVTCYARNRWACSALGGVSIGTDEADVQRTLGHPVKPPQLSNARKVLTYGAAPTWIRFQLWKRQVEGITISSPDTFMQVTPPDSFYTE